MSPVRLGRRGAEPAGPHVHRVAKEGVGQEELALDGHRGDAGSARRRSAASP